MREEAEGGNEIIVLYIIDHILVEAFLYKHE